MEADADPRTEVPDLEVPDGFSLVDGEIRESGRTYWTVLLTYLDESGT